MIAFASCRCTREVDKHERGVNEEGACETLSVKLTCDVNNYHKLTLLELNVTTGIEISRNIA